MKANFLRLFVAAASLATSFSVQAEDIDLFVSPSTENTVKPNVLIIMDNTANWGSGNQSPQPFTNEKAALVSVLSSLPVDSFRVGLIMFSETGNPNDNVAGGYVRAALRLMNESNKAAYVNLVQSLDSNHDKGNNAVYGLAMAEAYRYFDGGEAYGGRLKVKRDYTGNTLATTGNNANGNPGYASSNAVYALEGNALASSSASTYTSPVQDGCQRNFIIFISNGPVSNNDSDGVSDQPRSMLIQAYEEQGGYDNATAIAKSARIAISPTGETTSTANEWAKFLKSTFPGSVTTYTVDVNPATNGQGPAHSALLKSMANVSDGKYLAVSSDSSAIANALNSILSEIQSVNSAFASVSLPVSVNAQGTYLNQVFIGMFRPDTNAGPRWAGNLKQYRLGYSEDELKLVDAAGAAAINTSTNFITECARSYWTPSTTDNYWEFSPKGDCLGVENSDLSDSPDGAVVEKGGQSYGLRVSSPASRNVLTCSPVFANCDASTDSLVSFDADNSAITSGLLGAVSAAERTDLISWARGQDVSDLRDAGNNTIYVGDENGNENTSETRPSVHGDVVHSRPVAVNFGTVGSPDVMVFYGGNDGLLHAINGNRTAASNGFTAGRELWSFMPPEFYSKIKRLRANAPAVRYMTSDGPTNNPPKDYGVDGAVTAFMGQTSASGSDKVFIYFGMRRGGRALYAFDVTDSTDPDLKWKIGCPSLTDDTGCTSGFADIGQTWSSATVLKADGYRDTSTVDSEPGFAKPMVIFGGGYDNCEDTDNGTVNHSCDSSSKGRKIYVVDANTGRHLKTFITVRPVVADVTVVPGTDGLATYAYAADTGGNIYRITIGSAAPADWSIAKIASLGCSTMSSCDANRKFMFAPEVVLRDGVYYLQIGSGDREKPLAVYGAATSVSNYFFNIADKPGDSTWLAQDDCDSDGTACLSSLLPITSSTPSQTELDNHPRGWYLALAGNEQVVTSAVTLFGYSTFNTHTPTSSSNSSCTSLGTNKSYRISYRDASGEGGDRYEVLEGGGLSPSPVSGIVQLDPEDGGAEIPFVCTLDCEAAEPTYTSQTQPKRRVYWNVEK